MEKHVDKPVRFRRSASLALGQRLRQAVNAGRWFRRATLELAFPATCAGCEAELEDGAEQRPPFCAECLQQLAILSSATCLRCAARVPESVSARERCYLCRDTKLWFDEAVALGVYTGLLRDWLLEMKRQQGDARSLAIAELVWQHCGDRMISMKPDVVVPVPMYWRRRWTRGTNSAALLAEVFAHRLGVPLASGLLRRMRNTAPQFSLPPSARPGNVRRAFAVRAGYHLDMARVLLVDDILTTGSTCSEAARALKQNGALHVGIAVAARTLAR